MFCIEFRWSGLYPETVYLLNCLLAQSVWVPGDFSIHHSSMDFSRVTFIAPPVHSCTLPTVWNKANALTQCPVDEHPSHFQLFTMLDSPWPTVLLRASSVAVAHKALVVN